MKKILRKDGIIQKNGIVHGTFADPGNSGSGPGDRP